MNEKAKSAHVMLVDDDRELCTMLSEFLAADGIEVAVSHSGEDGLERIATTSTDLVVLDIMLPGANGLDVLKQLRQTSRVPVIMLTARGDDVDRIIGLELGADDYLAKPFNPRELLARIKAILRRAQPAPVDSACLRLGGIELDPRTRKASVAERPLQLTGTEYQILKSLLETPGEVVSKEQLSEKALGRKLLPYDRSIDTHISNLRGKLEQAGGTDVTIRNQRGVGYLLLPGT